MKHLALLEAALVLCFFEFGTSGCKKTHPFMNPVPPQEQTISQEQAVSIARQDAVRAYRDLSKFDMAARLGEEGWHVDWEPKNPDVQGGGPHYIIDAKSGRILHKKYEQ